MKILNLYAGLGGNRALWGDEHDVLAIDINPTLCGFYKKRFPDDQVVCEDAHKYLETIIQDGSDSRWTPDFIWSSPPCQTHSSFRQNICVRYRGTPPVYPDMKLWQEILFLQANATCNWVVENVKPYYTPLIPPSFTIGRHYFWSNKVIDTSLFTPRKSNIRSAQIKDLQLYHDIDLSGVKISNKRQLLRNMVDYEVGKFVMDEIMKQPFKEVEDGEQ